MNRSPMTTCGGGTLQESITETWQVDATIATTRQVTLSQTPFSDSLLVFLNGILLIEGLSSDYIRSGLTLTFAVGSLFESDQIVAHYTGS